MTFQDFYNVWVTTDFDQQETNTDAAFAAVSHFIESCMVDNDGLEMTVEPSEYYDREIHFYNRYDWRNEFGDYAFAISPGKISVFNNKNEGYLVRSFIQGSVEEDERVARVYNRFMELMRMMLCM